MSNEQDLRTRAIREIRRFLALHEIDFAVQPSGIEEENDMLRGVADGLRATGCPIDVARAKIACEAIDEVLADRINVDTTTKLADLSCVIGVRASLKEPRPASSPASVEALFGAIDRAMSLLSQDPTHPSTQFKVFASSGGAGAAWFVRATSSRITIEGGGESLVKALQRCAESVTQIVEETVSKAEATITGQRNAAIALRALLPTQRDQDV